MKESILFLLIFTFCILQVTAQDEDIISYYEDYTEIQRETVYLHLNKSTFIKGESIGLQAYVFDKTTKQISTETSNLYCVISDANNNVVKKKLLMITNGIGINDFVIDSTFTSGEYKIAAYTNWMKNFDEKNFYLQKIRIIDPDIENEAKQLSSSSDIDVQFLPEGGHLVANIKTVIGVAIKDSYGFGVPDVSCTVLDNSGNELTNFKVDEMGLGRFSLTPELGKTYKVSMKIDEKDHIFDIKDIKPKGLGLSVNRIRENMAITIKTNSSTLNDLQNKIYTLAIHNGDQLNVINLKFNDELEILKALSNDDLFPGINIITLFDHNNTPILERQIFNHKGIDIVSSKDLIIEKDADSLLISIPYKDLDVTLFNNFSISVLPSETRAYNHHENIISSTWLQPYVKGYIENSDYYFKSITPKKQYQLDNLLLTQGWSSYDWDTIFTNPPDYDYDFENGISYVANFTNNNSQQLIIYPMLNSPMEIIELKPGEMAFEKQGFFPISDEKIEIGAINAKGKPTKPNVVLKFSPDVIPDFENIFDYDLLRPREIRNSEMSNYRNFENGWKKIEQLDEVKLTGQRIYTKVERIKNSTVGKVTFIDDKIKRHYKSILNFVDTKGFNAYLHPGSIPSTFVITNRTKTSINFGQSTIVYLDDMVLHGDHSILIGMTLDDVEYIETNTSGLGAGIRGGGGGVIRIKTNPFKSFENPEPKVEHKSFEIPLKFDVAKRFYIPKYNSYSSSFFNEYGVIDWFSNVSTDKDGVLKLKLFNNKESNIKLFIEGVSSDGSYISEVKKLKIN